MAETKHLKQQLDEMRELIEKMNNAQQQNQQQVQQHQQQFFNHHRSGSKTHISNSIKNSINNNTNPNFRISATAVDATDAFVEDVADAVAAALTMVVVSANIVGCTDCAVTTEGSAATLHKDTNMMQPWRTAWAVTLSVLHEGVG